MLEREYICWHKGQSESDGKELKAPSVQAAAKKAVDIWRHERIQELNGDKVTVFVRDQEVDEVREIIVSAYESGPDAPEAFI